ncbi:NAD(P)H-dependent oxidoreductase [Polaromonas sp. C04]|uniref:flavodoxin family protein n=1 Tax=Polaromonas sp. C04 TaxID=1945857 RepID=UPI0009848AFD|nr:NAD(P)H-dependent oxidoreductase [Polaromonas sp. C04]OOG58003.1 hypothetical protein B0E49_03965 [Polaromonas sp. C04]
MKILAILCSPHPSKRTKAAVEAVLAGAASGGSATELREVADGRWTSELEEAVLGSDAVVLASPTFRADVAWPLKVLLDEMRRGDIASPGPLLRKVCATVMSGGSAHHFMGGDKVRSVLDSFFGTQLLCPGIYVTPDDFSSDGTLVEPMSRRLNIAGQALVELAGAVKASPSLRAHMPLI